jgi:Ca2+-binding EF-hand superfamily protein
MAPLVPRPEVARRDLWRRFLSAPGVWQLLMQDLAEIQATMPEEGEHGTELLEPASEDDFQPTAESSRISQAEASCRPASPRSPLPPMSPRTPRTPDPTTDSDTSSVFFLEKNIDQVPERNVSPRREGVRVAVITPTPGRRPTTPWRPAPPPRTVTAPRPPASLPPLHTPLLPVLPPGLVSEVQAAFAALPEGLASPLTAASLCPALGLSPLLASSLWTAVYGPGTERGGCARLLSFWQQHSGRLTGPDRLLHLLRGPDAPGPALLPAARLLPLADAVLATHPHLEFFRGPAYAHLHPAYLDAVVASLLWGAGAWRRGRLDRWQLARLDLPGLLARLADPGQELNTVPHFSYEQFFVLYVKFVELDPVETGSLRPGELLNFEGGGQLTDAVVERVFSRCVAGPAMNFPEWVHFVLAQVDPGDPSAIAYWLAVLDLDDDGLLSLAELRPFYTASLELLDSCGVPVQPVAWTDLATQLLDTTGPPGPDGWSTGQLRANARLPHIINAFVNIFRFVLEDESDVCIRSAIPAIHKFVLKSLQDMES